MASKRSINTAGQDGSSKKKQLSDKLASVILECINAKEDDSDTYGDDTNFSGFDNSSDGLSNDEPDGTAKRPYDLISSDPPVKHEDYQASTNTNGVTDNHKKRKAELVALLDEDGTEKFKIPRSQRWLDLKFDKGSVHITDLPEWFTTSEAWPEFLDYVRGEDVENQSFVPDSESDDDDDESDGHHSSSDDSSSGDCPSDDGSSEDSSSEAEEQSPRLKMPEIKDTCSRECKIHQFSSPRVIYVAQTIVWQVLYYLGKPIAPFASGDHATTPTDEIRQKFHEIGCFTDFFLNEQMAKGRTGKDINGHTYPDPRYNRPGPAMHLFGVGIKCEECGDYHDDYDVTFSHILLLGSGMLSDRETLEEFAYGPKQLSHRCGNAFCPSPVHLTLESAADNMDREPCQSHNPHNRTTCTKHDPSCILLPLVSFGRLYQANHASFQAVKNKAKEQCPYADCGFYDNGPNIMYHIMTFHAEYEPYPMKAADLYVPCPGCNTRVMTNKTLKDHESKREENQDNTCHGKAKHNYEAVAERGYTLVGPGMSNLVKYKQQWKKG